MSDRREQIENEITALKMLLADTDYQVTKYAEGLTACSTQKEENAFREAFMAQYGDIIASRVQWRQRINELEEERDALPDPRQHEGFRLLPDGGGHGEAGRHAADGVQRFLSRRRPGGRAVKGPLHM